MCLAALAATGSATCRRPSPADVPSAPAVVSIGVAQPRRGVAPDIGVAGVALLLQSASLLTPGPGGRPQPALAERWETSADGLTWRLALRRGLAFHDGTSLDAVAVRDLLQPDLGQPGSRIPPGLRDIVGVDAPRDNEVVVRLRQPSSLLLEALTLLPVRGGGDGRSGAGPFTLAASAPGQTSLRAFDRFYRGPPAVARVELRSYSTQRAAWGAMMRGEIDVLYDVEPDALAFLQAGANARAFTFLRPYVYLVGFNLAHPVLARRDVRVALNHAIDRQVVVARAFGGRGVPASGHVWPRFWAFDTTVQPAAHDPARARRLLDEAGMTMAAAGLAAGEGGHAPSRFRLTALLPADYPLLERLALVVQKELADVGVDLALEPVAPVELQQRLADGRFEAYINEMAAGQGMNWPYWFWHSAPGDVWVRSGYTGADATLDRLAVARTDDELRAAVAAFQRVLVQDPPGLFLGWSETSRAVRREFEVAPEGDRDIMATLPQWRLAVGPAPSASPARVEGPAPSVSAARVEGP
jgi:peptide/nickel transport system substrate-binding protein